MCATGISLKLEDSIGLILRKCECHQCIRQEVSAIKNASRVKNRPPLGMMCSKWLEKRIPMNATSQYSSQNLIWIDLEMTGLDPGTDKVIEIATVVTDQYLNVIEEGPVIAINQLAEIMDNMDEWNTHQHGKSGLTDRVLQSEYSEEQAARETIEFLEQFLPSGASPMCGNSICQDRRFMARHMPDLEKFFHYRNLDVSTLKELVKRWAPGLENGFAKKGSHLALDDIYDSIAELVYYREHFISL